MTLFEEISNCTSCPLHTSRINVVPGIGNLNAEIMFLGEGPGENEDLQGEPFVGRSGDLLNEALEAAGLSRQEIFITNAVKCRPPGNRNPLQEEMEACSPFLISQINKIAPKIIITLGKISAEFLLKRNVRITKENGHLDFMKSGLCVMTVYHPAYVLRNRKPETVESFFQAIKNAREIAYGIPRTANAGIYEEGT